MPAKKADRLEIARSEIRRLVTALHQEIYNLRWNEGRTGEQALIALSDEFASVAKRAMQNGVTKDDWNGGICEQVETAEAVAKLMAPRK